MIAAARLSLRLLRLGGRRAALSAGLVGAGVAVGTVLLCLALGGLHGWDARDQRTAWRADLVQADTGREVATGGFATAAGRTEFAGGNAITVVEVAAAPGAPAPPGLTAVPAPGQVVVSPALAALLERLPADELAGRFPAAPAGTIADTGLRGPDELVALVGVTTPPEGAVAITDWATAPGDGRSFGMTEVYRQLTWIAVVLLVFPVASLLGASARLTAARRTQRLALLRLLGASTRQITVVGVAETTAVAALASALGVLLYVLLSPAVALIELGGGAWFPSDVTPAPLVLLGVVAGTALLATGAAVVGLRRVVVGPLGVARRSEPGGARLLRLLGVVAAFVLFFAVRAFLQQNAASNVTGIVFGVAILGMFGAAYLVGPLVVRLLGTVMVRRSRTPALLLAGRRLLDDPKGAFRPLAGLTLAVFVAGFLAPLTGTFSTGPDRGTDEDALLLRAPDTASRQVLLEQTRTRLVDLGTAAAVEPTGERSVSVLPVADADVDRVRTALAPLVPGRAITTEAEEGALETVLVGDLLRGVYVVLAATFVMAATATGTTAAARVLDHRRTLRSLRLAGTPLSVLDAARRAETVRPLLLVGGIALGLGLFCASPFAAAAAVLEPASLILLGSVVVAGVALVVAASAASRPLLRSVTTQTERED